MARIRFADVLIAKDRPLALAAAQFVTLVGALALAGWLFDIDRLKSFYGGGGITMKANAALCLLLAGVSLWILVVDAENGIARRIGQASATIVALVGIATLSEHIIGWDLGIDQLLFREEPGATATSSPGRMGPPASTCLTLAGIALLLLHAGRGFASAQLLAIGVSLISLLSIIGYTYRVDRLYSVARYTGIALHTAAALFTLSIGLLAARAERGITAAISGDGSGSLMARRLMIFAIGLPFLLGWLRLLGQSSGYYDFRFGTAALVLAIIVLMTALIWKSAARLNLMEQRRIAAEAEVRGSEERLLRQAALIELSYEPIFVWSFDDGILEWNRGCEQLYGFTRAEAAGHSSQDLLRAMLPVSAEEHHHALVSHGRWSGEVRQRDSSGRELVVESRQQMIRSGSKRLVLETNRDITERKHTEQALADRLQEIETMMEVLPIGLFMTLDHGAARIIGNRAAREFLRIEPQSDANLSLSAPPEEAPAHFRVLKDGRELEPDELPVQRAMREGITVNNEELEIVFDDGTIKHELISAAPLLGADGKPRGAVASLMDITERRLAEREREDMFVREQAMRVEAEAANRAKDEFLATVSHELRTPLNAMLGWATLLRGRIPDESMVDDALETIERNCRLQAQLIEDLLDVSRINAGKLRLDVRPVELASVVTAALEAVQHAANAKSIRIEMSPRTSAASVLGDATRIQQVVWNLLSNAVKFTPRGGSVVVAVDTSESEALITVQDTGEGIRPDFLPYVFDRFRQADGTKTRRHGGLGLGLAIARHLVEAHGGTIEGASEGPGRGSTFTVRLPLLSRELSAWLAADSPIPRTDA